MSCDNCGDDSGWTPVPMMRFEDGATEWVWFACADCNDDGVKPKPDVCEACGHKEVDCECELDPLWEED